LLTIVTEAMLVIVDDTLDMESRIRYLDVIAPQIDALGDTEGAAQIRHRARQYRRMIHEMTEMC
jgi:hypothetical protein